MKVLTEDTNFTSPTRDATSIFCGYQSHGMALPSLLSCCGALRVLVQSQGSNPGPPTLKWKLFLAVAVVVAWARNCKWSFRIILMKGPFLIPIGLCTIWFDNNCMSFSFCFFTQYTPPDYLPKVYEDLPMSHTHRETVINAFVYVHQTLHQAKERLAKQGGRGMAITPRHYLDFINHYVSTIHDSEIVKTMVSMDGVGGGIIRLPPMWLGFKSQCWRHTWAEFVVGSFPCSERFLSGFPGFTLSLKTNTSKFQFDLERRDTFKQRTYQSYVVEQILRLLKTIIQYLFLPS